MPLLPSPYHSLLRGKIGVQRLFDDIQLSIKAVAPALPRDFAGMDVAPALVNFRRLYEEGDHLHSESIVIPDYIDAS